MADPNTILALLASNPSLLAAASQLAAAQAQTPRPALTPQQFAGGSASPATASTAAPSSIVPPAASGSVSKRPASQEASAGIQGKKPKPAAPNPAGTGSRSKNWSLQETQLLAEACKQVFVQLRSEKEEVKATEKWDRVWNSLRIYPEWSMQRNRKQLESRWKVLVGASPSICSLLYQSSRRVAYLGCVWDGVHVKSQVLKQSHQQV